MCVNFINIFFPCRSLSSCFVLPIYRSKYQNLKILILTAKATLKFGSEAWILKKREEQRLEAAQIKFFRHLLGITKLNKQKSQCIRQKTRAQNIVKNKTVPEKVATTCTGDGHKQTTKTSTTILTKRTKEHRTTEEEMEEPTSS